MATNGVVNGQSVPNGHTSHNIHPKITLYTNHRCPWAHRAHIALNELDLPFEEIIIDLDTPRPQWYLDINPRGLVPAIKYSVPGVMDEEIIYESGIVAQYLCDSFPSHVLPASKETPTSALRRAKTNFFVDTFFSKVASFQFAAMRASSAEEKETKCKEWAAAVEKEIEPLLADANPFFGDSKGVTFAEVMTAPFVVRWRSLSKDGQLLPSSLLESLDKLPKFSQWSQALMQKESIMKIYDEPAIVEGTKRKVKQMMSAQK